MNASTLRVIWIALTISIVLYGVIAFIAVLPSEPAQPFDAFFSNPIILGAHVMGLTMLIMSFVIPPVLSRRGPKPQSFVIRWAMIESAAIFGLVAAFIGEDPRLFLPLGALAIAAILLAFPPREA